VKDLYNENYETMKKEIEEGIEDVFKTCQVHGLAEYI
jgi:hypothetical protein